MFHWPSTCHLCYRGRHRSLLGSRQPASPCDTLAFRLIQSLQQLRAVPTLLHCFVAFFAQYLTRRQPLHAGRQQHIVFIIMEGFLCLHNSPAIASVSLGSVDRQPPTISKVTTTCPSTVACKCYLSIGYRAQDAMKYHYYRRERVSLEKTVKTRRSHFVRIIISPASLYTGRPDPTQ